MRIGMEISPLIWEMSGIPNYILRLLKGLASIDSENEYFLYTNRPIPFDMGLPCNFKTSNRNLDFPLFPQHLTKQLIRSQMSTFPCLKLTILHETSLVKNAFP